MADLADLTPNAYDSNVYERAETWDERLPVAANLARAALEVEKVTTAAIRGLEAENSRLRSRLDALERWVRSHDADPDCLS